MPRAKAPFAAHAAMRDATKRAAMGLGGIVSTLASRRALGNLRHSPLAWILLALFVLRIVGIGWGLPASDGWDNDGVAPRDFLAGLVETVTPGRYYTYPPVHLCLLALLTAPVTLVALGRAHSLAAHDVVAEILKVPYMTTIAVVARLVSVGMSLGIVWAVAKTAEELRGRRVGLAAAALVGVNVPLTYYAHTTNLDVPYLFWGALAILALVRAIVRREPRRLVHFGVLAALSIGTKDQAYALFLLSVPAAIGMFIALDEWARREWRTVLKAVLTSTAAAGALLVVVDGVVYNPAGFRARLRFLTGPASQAYAQYSSDSAGRADVVSDVFARFDRCYPVAFAVLVAAGIAVVLFDGWKTPPKLAASLVPLFVGVSFTVAFNCVARRTDERFVLPQTVLAAVYGGVGLDALVRRFGSPAVLTAAAAFAVALFGAADVDANLLLDPRYDAEAWLRAHTTPGDTIETYGLNVYMPRFAAGTHVVRVGPEPEDHRNPMPGVEEVTEPYDEAARRGAKYIVVSEGWVWRYLLDPALFPASGRTLPLMQVERASDGPTTAYFRALVSGQYKPYRLAYAAKWKSALWPRLDLHASLSREVWIYERQ